MIKSNSLPGVATIISAPLSNAICCVLIFTPPNTPTADTLIYGVNLLTASTTCTTNSLVGTKTKI